MWRLSKCLPYAIICANLSEFACFMPARPPLIYSSAPQPSTSLPKVLMHQAGWGHLFWGCLSQLLSFPAPGPSPGPAPGPSLGLGTWPWPTTGPGPGLAPGPDPGLGPWPCLWPWPLTLPLALAPGPGQGLSGLGWARTYQGWGRRAQGQAAGQP